jgi:8-oxo-dGTP pyrophosphatase MutT (NUDIX family)
MHPFLKYLQERTNQVLPGKQAQMKMAPEPVDGGPNRLYDPPPGVRRSSVLIPFLSASEQDLNLLFTLRSPNIRHGGQISFPGGRIEAHEKPEEAALREANEEVGIQPEKIQILGSVSDLYINHSNNQITPFLGLMTAEPELVLQEEEVAEAFFIPFDELIREELKKHETWELKNNRYRVPYWTIHEVPLWGATAMILSEVIELYEEFRKL